MAGKFVDLKDAAKMLGVTAEDLVDMRSRGEIFGYRDGASWKFKLEEVERVNSERSSAGKSGTGSGVLSPADDDFETIISDSGVGLAATNNDFDDDNSTDSVLVNEELLGGSAIIKQSTVIGKDLRGKRPEDSDLKLAGDEDKLAGAKPPSSISGISLMGESSTGGAESSLGLGDSNIQSGSSVKGDSNQPQQDDSVLGDVELSSRGSGTGVLGSGNEDSVDLDITGGSDAYALSEESLAVEDDESISLDASDLKKGPGTGSDVTYSPGDSGINLRSPSDSGLSLDEEPLDLGGSGVDQLELPEDDDVIALEEEADPEMATQLKADEAFSLSPASLEGGNDDDSDSGSQVIALEDSSAF